MLQCFIGYDPRQPLAYSVLQHSIISNCSVPVAITPLILKTLPVKRRGLTEFTFSRFLVPYLCGFKGSAVFMDADIAVTGDIKELFDQSDMSFYDVQVMKNQPKFEWGSVMLFNNPRCIKLTPEFIADESNQLLDLAWARSVGPISDDWNHCVNKVAPRESKLYHFTEGIPYWDEVRGSPLDKVWFDAYKAAIHSVEWLELMGNSVHAEPVIKRFVSRKLGIDIKKPA